MTRPAGRGLGSALLVAVAVAAVVRLAHGPGSLGYDALWGLRWGREILAGHAPDFAAAAAPTPHPLANLVSAGLMAFGSDTATTALLAVSWLSLGALAWALARLGAALFSWPVGVFAAVAVVTRGLLVIEAGQALVDLPFLALAVAAADREVRHPRAGPAVPVLLLLAGLLRPEGWALELAYLAYRWPGLDAAGRARLGALLAAAPLLWAGMDLWATGDGLHSLHGTHALGEALDRPHSTHTALTLAPGALRDVVQQPLLWVALAGACAGLLLRDRASALPGAMVILGLAGYLVLGVAGLPLLGRYLLLPATMLILFAGLAVFGWTALGPHERRRRLWQVGGAAAAVVVLAGVPSDVRALRDARTYGALRHEVQDGLRAAVRATDGRRCGRLVAPDRRSLAVVVAQRGRPDAAAPGALAFAYSSPERAAGYALGVAGPRRLPPGSRRVFASRSWLVGATGC